MVSIEDLECLPSESFEEALANPGRVPEAAEDFVVDIPTMIHRAIEMFIDQLQGQNYTMKDLGNQMWLYGRAEFPNSIEYSPRGFQRLKEHFWQAEISYEIPEVGQRYTVDMDHEPDYHKAIRLSVPPQDNEFLRKFRNYAGFQSRSAALRHLIYYAIVFKSWRGYTDERMNTKPGEIALKGVYKTQRGIQHHNELMGQLDKVE